MYQKTKIPEILVDREWNNKEINKLATQFDVTQSNVQAVLDFHFSGVLNSLCKDKTNIEVTDLLRFQLKPKPVLQDLEVQNKRLSAIQLQYKNSPIKLALYTSRVQQKIDYLKIKLTNFKNLGNEF